jgi:hypothetical protein
MGDLMELEPKGVLEFKINANKSARTTLVAKNTSSSKAIAIKVKTTQPNWYYVRPNQDVLGPGESRDIEITLIESESRRSYALHLKGMPLDLSRHRFMAQCCTLTDKLATEICELQGDSEEKKKAFASLWDPDTVSSESGPTKNTKLKVVYNYSDDNTLPSEMGLDENGNAVAINKKKAVVVESVSSRVEKMRLEFKEMAEKADYGTSRVVPDSFESALHMFTSLKRKYVALEDWTMSLTGELDTVRAEVDGLSSQVARAKTDAAAAGKSGSGSGGSKSSSTSKNKDEGALLSINMDKDKSLFMGIAAMRLSLLIVGAGVLLAYLAGRNVAPVLDYDQLAKAMGLL